MSREAKIGLLVALAFLLVIGLLLSDQVAVATQEPPAPLLVTAQNARGSLSVPGHAPSGPVLPRQIDEPTTLHVYRPKPPETATQDDLSRSPPAPDDAASGAGSDPIGGGDSDRGQPVPDGASQTAATKAEVSDTTWAEGIPQTTAVNTTSAPGQPPEVPVVGVKDHAAVPGDTLGGLAKRYLGSDSPENRGRLAALNPSLAADPDLIVAGRTYRVPADAKAAAEVKSRPAMAQKTYVVQPGDNLWKIASKQLGSSARRAEIVSLNRDNLPDPDSLQVGQVLRLPG